MAIPKPETLVADLARTVSCLPAGLTVTLGGRSDAIRATINGVCVRGEAITYEVVWWDKATRKVEWVAAHEVFTECDGLGVLKIGFRG